MGSIADLVTQAAQRYGQDPSALLGVAKIESGLNPNAQNPGSSAGGLFQFIDSTANRYGLSNRFDPAAAADAGAHLMADNGAYLQRALGRPATPGELYLAHQQGAGGAAKILSQPDASAEATVGSRAFYGNGGRAGQTNAQFAQQWADKLAGALGQVGAGSGGSTGANAARTPQAGTSLAEALPGATLPTLAVAPDAPDPGAQAVANAGRQFDQRQQADAAAARARRVALLGGGGLARFYG